VERCGLNACGSGLGAVAGSCEHGNEPSGYIKYEEFLELLSDLASQEGLCFMELELIEDRRNV
jgi:hypothetical protein